MSHANTRIYEIALELNGDCAKVVNAMPVGLGFLSDQLRRASSSVVLNFSEGYRKRSSRDRERYFDTAAGSAREVGAIIDVAAKWSAVDDETRSSIKDRCDHLCAMLHRFRDETK